MLGLLLDRVRALRGILVALTDGLERRDPFAEIISLDLGTFELFVDSSLDDVDRRPARSGWAVRAPDGLREWHAWETRSADRRPGGDSRSRWPRGTGRSTARSSASGVGDRLADKRRRAAARAVLATFDPADLPSAAQERQLLELWSTTAARPARPRKVARRR